MTRHGQAVDVAPPIPTTSYTGVRERLEDIFDLGAALTREGLVLGSNVRECEVGPGASLGRPRALRSFRWEPANRLTGVVVNGSATVGGAPWTFLNSATVGTTRMLVLTALSAGWAFRYDAPVTQKPPEPFPAVARALRTELVRRQVDLANWDEDDGDRPNEKAFDDALAFIELIPPAVPPPSLYVSGDAEVGFSGCGTTASSKLLFAATARSDMRPGLVEI
jgi:hypothetical protein